MHAVMPAMVVPVAVVPVMAPMAIVADAARTEMGPNHRAAAIRGIIGIIVIRVIRRAIEEAPVKVRVVCEPIAAPVEDRTGAEPATMEHGAATMEAATVKHRTTAAVKTSAAMEATTTVEASASTAVSTTTTSTAAVSATVDFGRQPVGRKFRRGGNAGIDQRERLSALRNS